MPERLSGGTADLGDAGMSTHGVLHCLRASARHDEHTLGVEEDSSSECIGRLAGYDEGHQDEADEDRELQHHERTAQQA
ncbi:hypothetical protein D3C83_149170 [compost metagenome]